MDQLCYSLSICLRRGVIDLLLSFRGDGEATALPAIIWSSVFFSMPQSEQPYRSYHLVLTLTKCSTGFRTFLQRSQYVNNANASEKGGTMSRQQTSWRCHISAAPSAAHLISSFKVNQMLNNKQESDVFSAETRVMGRAL